MKMIYKIDKDLVFDSLEKIMLNDMVNRGYFIIQAYERKGLDEKVWMKVTEFTHIFMIL